MYPSISTEACPGRAHVRLLIAMRAGMLAVLTATVFAVHMVFEITIPLAPVLGAIGVLACGTAVAVLRLRTPRDFTDGEIFAQCLVDVGVLSCVLYFTGGAVNPFAYCFLLIVMYGVRALPRQLSWLLAALCILCYTGLQFYHVELPMPATQAADRVLNYAAHWMFYALLAILVPWLGIRLGEIQAQHYQRIRHDAEKDARERYLVGLAALAAGTAHEMGTPLSTMSVVVGDMRRSKEPPADWKNCVDVLWQQLQSCKRSLSELVDAADPQQLGIKRDMRARQLIESLVERIQLLRPEAALTVHNGFAANGPVVRADATLQQALLSLINNAVDVSPQAVELRALQSGGKLHIDILDRGPGIPAELRAQLGRRAVTTKAAGRGCGLGILVANTAIERLGGSVRLSERDGGGTCVHVELPALRNALKEGDHALFRKSGIGEARESAVGR